jgi:hypothetical protein
MMAEPLSWTIHRAKETPAKTVVASVFMLAFVVFSWVVFGPVLGMLAVVVLFLALNTYFLPVTYTFTDKGIEVDKRLFRARYEWKQFRRWFRTSGGIVISPFSRKSYLDNFRGVHLLLPAGTSRISNVAGRMTNDGQQAAPSVQTEDIVAYLEKRFAPPPPDDRLRLEEPGEGRSQNAEGRTQNGGQEPSE